MSKIDRDLFLQSESDLYGEYVRPLIAKLLALMKMDLVYHRGHGENLYTYKSDPKQSDTPKEIEVKDFLGGFGTQLFGHSRSEITEALLNAVKRGVPFQSQSSIRLRSAQLAEQINKMLDNERKAFGLEDMQNYIATFTNSGAESVEAAIKLCLTIWRNKKQKIIHAAIQRVSEQTTAESLHMARTEIEDLQKQAEQVRPVFVALQRGFHGKTSGAVALTANPEYSSMFERVAVQVIFLDPGKLTTSEIELQLDAQMPVWKKIFKQYGLSPFAGIIYEPIQAEGGIHPLSNTDMESLSEFAKNYKIPIVADEIQSGWMRCGYLALSHQKGVSPDILLFGKALGGGIVKTGVMLAKKSTYEENFGFKHTSTFAEDEISAEVMLAVCNLIIKEKENIQKSAQRFENRLKEFSQKLSNQYPGIIRQMRGQGFLLGLELNSDYEKLPFLISALYNSGFGSYFLSSYLLNHYQLRLGVTLSSPMTLRIEPCFTISDEAIQRLEIGLRDVVECLSQSRTGKLTAHLWKETSEVEKIASPIIPKLNTQEDEKRICFLGHLVSEKNVRNVDPVLKKLSARDLGKVLEVSEVIELGAIIEQAHLQDVAGHKAHFHMYGFFNTSDYFERHHRSGDPKLLSRLQRVVSELEDSGIEYIGLGQFTSIIGWNGLGLKVKPTTKLTTGNSLTVATALLSAEKIIEQQGRQLSELKVGVVGVTGNICSVFAEIIASKVSELKIFYRDQKGASDRFQKVYTSLLNKTGLSQEKISASANLDDLKDRDLIIVGTNSTKPIIYSQHLKKNAVVVDVSVPANVHPSVLLERLDVICFSGGLVKLPKDQRLMEWLSGLPDGEVFACLAETLMMAFLKVEKPYSYGPLTKESVERVIRDFYKVGFELGQRTYMSALL